MCTHTLNHTMLRSYIYAYLWPRICAYIPGFSMLHTETYVVEPGGTRGTRPLNDSLSVDPYCSGPVPYPLCPPPPHVIAIFLYQCEKQATLNSNRAGHDIKKLGIGPCTRLAT